MKFPALGVALYGTEPATEGVELARLAEELGYQRFWVGDSHMIWREVYVLLGGIAMATKRIAMGPGVTHPQVRHLTVTASAMVTLNEISCGRAFLGFGVGATGPGNVGLKPASLSELKEAVMSLMQLMKGESLEIDHQQVQCVFAQADPIPLFVGTRSPWAMKMVSQLGDGIVYTGAVSTLTQLVADVRQYAAESGRAAGDVRVIYRVPTSIAHNPTVAREAVKGKIARSALTHLGRLHKRGELHNKEDQRAVERLWNEYDTYHHMGPEHSHLVRDHWVDEFALAGTPDQVRSRLTEIVETGVDEVTIVPFGESKFTVIEQFARKVVGS